MGAVNCILEKSKGFGEKSEKFTKLPVVLSEKFPVANGFLPN